MSVSFLVCEPASRWVMALRLVLADADAPIREARGAATIWEWLADEPASIVCWSLELGAPSQTLEQVWKQRLQYPDAPAVVLGSRRLAGWRPAALEAGATDALLSPRELWRLARWTAAHLERHAEPPRLAAHKLVQTAWRLPF